MPITSYFVIGAFVIILIASLWFRRLLPPLVRRAIPFILIGIGGIDYLAKEFVFNKGPDDYGAQMHAQAIIVKERPSYWRIIRFLSYERDPNTPTAGNYRFSYEVSGQKGTLVCHYDKALGGFN